jgi:hypothetical protein
MDLPQHKKKAKAWGRALLFTDEASFRQDSTLHATWARKGSQPQIPVTGQRKSVKIFGAVEVYTARFLYKRGPVFNADTYGGFLEEIARKFRGKGACLIQDNASYHKDKGIWSWFKSNRHWLEVFHLPPYSPEFNAIERMWQHTRRCGTHNRYFKTEGELLGTLTHVFGTMQSTPEVIRGYLRPFC